MYLVGHVGGVPTARPLPLLGSYTDSHHRGLGPTKGTNQEPHSSQIGPTCLFPPYQRSARWDLYHKVSPTTAQWSKLICRKPVLWGWVPYFLGSFNTNYIIFRNVENFNPPQKKTLKSQKIVKENIESFKYIRFVEMTISKLIS
jgi:hypothetical protein